MRAFYLAGKYTAKPRLRIERDRLVERGFVSVSRWLDHNLIEAEVDRDGLVREAMSDLEDLRNADTFIIDTRDVSETGGREVELGFAMALRLYTIVVGPSRNIFHNLAGEHYMSWTDFWLNNKALDPYPPATPECE